MDKLILIILDGWGLGKKYPGNVIDLASTPNFDRLIENYPNSQLIASGEAVGLPDGQMGNSEVGHMNIGSGRIIFQDLTRINNDIKSKKFFDNKVLVDNILKAKENKKKLHLMGLVSFGGVHSHFDHLLAILDLCKKLDFYDVYIHCFTDGRDVSPTSSINDIKLLQDYISKIGLGKIATISGRYYAMDRDKRWDRTKLAYEAISKGNAKTFTNPLDYIQESYDSGVSDEFIIPGVYLEDGKVTSKVDDGDSIIMFNFRPDRARQLTRAFIDEDFSGFERDIIGNLSYVTMTNYDDTIKNVSIAYPKESYENTLGEFIANKRYKQLRIAETEKYAHVTFFFNGGREEENPNEDRILIPSPKVKTYDLKPEMSAIEVKNSVLEAINKDIYKLIILNFANTDMVGHTGVIESDKIAVETVDKCLGEILDVVNEHNYYALITADHGNSEYLIDENTNEPFTAHTTNPVPFIEYPDKNLKLKDGILADISPTILDLLKLEKPDEMTGNSLIIREEK